MPAKLNNVILAAAIEGFEAQKKRIDAQIAEVWQLMTGGSAESARLPRTGGAIARAPFRTEHCLAVCRRG